MRKATLLKLLVCSGFAISIFASCKDDSNLKNSAAIPDQSFVQEFDTIAAAQAQGWKLVNRSVPIGRQGWVQGNSIYAQIWQYATVGYPAYSSKATREGFITSDISCADAHDPSGATQSNFLISPSIIMQNGDKIIFYTREDDSISRWADRLQVVYNVSGDDWTNAGHGVDPGAFKAILLDINPNYASGFTVGTTPVAPFDATIPYVPNNSTAYPRQWTRFEARVNGLNGPIRTRFAFRHFVELGGYPNVGSYTVGGRGEVISIDSVAFVSVSHH
jgi:hypothetical protein